VALAVKPIAHFDDKWEENEITKRITRYMHKAASDPELRTHPWKALVSELTHKMMNGYSGPCGEKEWFNQIDLVPALCGTAWELLAFSGQDSYVTGDILQQEVTDAWEAELDLHLIRKAIWSVVEECFTEEKIRSKVNNAVSKSLQPALEKVLNGMTFQQARRKFDEKTDLKCVQDFTMEWIEEVTNRIWGACEHEPDLEGTLTMLFQRLVAPFGVEDEFTCFPGVLCGRIGRPPPDWDHIPTVIDTIMSKWNGDSPEGPSKKQKKAAGVGGARPFDAFGQKKRPVLEDASDQEYGEGEELFEE
jgi:hypothetical protein